MAKKPSSQIIDIMSSLAPSASGDGWHLTESDRMLVLALCKAVDKRDQQLRKNAKLPAMASKKAKRKATKAAARR